MIRLDNNIDPGFGHDTLKMNDEDMIWMEELLKFTHLWFMNGWNRGPEMRVL